MKTWNEMTPVERDEYVNQDYVKQTEKILPRGFSENKDFDESWDISFERMNNKTMKHIIIEMYREGKTVEDILYHLPCTKQLIYFALRESNASK